jgi:deoxyribodipyrimidine photo-lyase
MPTARDLPGVAGTSRLSENLTYGEIGPAAVWHAGCAPVTKGARGRAASCKELVWREFRYHLMHHTPHITSRQLEAGMGRFPWRGRQPAPNAGGAA